jgi:hypothetical protein
LENVYRLDEVEARDAVCDNTLDKGVDGIYVDHNDQEVHFLQGCAQVRLCLTPWCSHREFQVNSVAFGGLS